MSDLPAYAWPLVGLILAVVLAWHIPTAFVLLAASLAPLTWPLFAPFGGDSFLGQVLAFFAVHAAFSAALIAFILAVAYHPLRFLQVMTEPLFVWALKARRL